MIYSQANGGCMPMPLLVNFTKSTPIATHQNFEQKSVYDPISQTTVYDMGAPHNTRSLVFSRTNNSHGKNIQDKKVGNDDIKYS